MIIPDSVEWIGIAVFALSGALTAARKHMDPFGFSLLATVTGIGGGTLRDVLLAQPVFWVNDPTDLLICIGVGVSVFILGSAYQGLEARLVRQNIFLWADALGLAIFAVTGTNKALNASAHPVAAVVLGTLAASFGSIIRDILSGEIPMLLHKEIYVTAAFVAAVIYVTGLHFTFGAPFAAALGIAAGFTLRALAISRNWSLPSFK